MRKICLLLIIIGALNWGLVGLFELNLVTAIFGDSLITRIIYIVIGLAGIVCTTGLFEDDI